MTKTIEVSVEVPETLEWQEIANIEDEVSGAVGQLLAARGLDRKSHTRRVEAVYE
jgi:hypothetical protein